MTRLELLMIVVGRARSNGFEFRRWYTTKLGLPWISAEAALALLEAQRRYYALLFSHEFASAFWKPGAEITFQVPAQTFQRQMPDGSIRTIKRKPFTRRSARPDAWRYHLSHMALAEEPLRYIRRYLNVEDDLTDDLVSAVSEESPAAAKATRARSVKKKSAAAAVLAAESAPPKRTRAKPIARPIPTDLPAFLRRPYHGNPAHHSQLETGNSKLKA
jgi:hypothetical protein